MMKEFKEFISRGNVMDMAVGIIIGGAFTAIVGSLVADIITPIIGMLMGGINFSELAVTVGSAQLTYGNFIQAIINFLLVAWVLFMIVKAMNKMKRKEEEKPAEPEAPAEPPEDIVLLREIRDSLKK
ncbi:MAG: large-conductance mechanosensitive channel protein MscL [Firmicutes bacterium]|jgi:large conductance mechanosensitive channel|nr:large-conductance mechanosensitive channel protein MscL [Bacillota bacterium]MBQ2596619.1 large-conductance mechanosensitive channel protein MscL [Oscillospiraceae bacterium]MBQ4409106.1 large-conductance mechanosensitive channel protein MscL [Bacillota bacterium]MBQ6295193.1 large-conductance mechanosensitive channel protein MscL [Bacillota bacterium]MBR0050823.1 large-conductance mechanosensitive channel protein MscL [Bacillota bacterium]